MRIGERSATLRVLAILAGLLTLAAILAGCLPCTTAGATRCVGGYAVQVCDGSPGHWQDALDCTTVTPGRWACVQPPDAMATCSPMDGGQP